MRVVALGFVVRLFKVFNECFPAVMVNFLRVAKDVVTIVPRKRIQRIEVSSIDLDERYETHEAFFEAVPSFLEQHDNHKFDAAVQSLRMK
ncbi:hypothetical protein V1523DRAFT_90260 [Lipomyces doorenjongii]